MTDSQARRRRQGSAAGPGPAVLAPSEAALARSLEFMRTSSLQTGPSLKARVLMALGEADGPSLGDLVKALEDRVPEDLALPGCNGRRGLLVMAVRELATEGKLVAGGDDDPVRLRPLPPDDRFEIDPSLRDLLPPPSPGEVAGLEAKLVVEGFRGTLVSWTHAGRTVLVDGYTRQGLCRRHHLAYTVADLPFPDRREVENWIWKEHYGRRNLTPEAQSYARGRHFLAAKLGRGGDRRSERAKCQNVTLKQAATFADRGEIEGQRGLWPAVEEFLAQGVFRIKQRYENNNGLSRAFAVPDTAWSLPVPTADELHALACRHAGAGQRLRAEQLLLQAVAADPRHAPSLYLLGTLAHDAGRAAEALGWFQRAAAVRPTDAVLLSCVGAAHQALGQFSEAARWHRDALRQRPDDPLALNNLGITLVSLGRAEEAASAFRQSLRVQPGEADTLCNLGAALHALDQPGEAADCYRQALARRPGLAQAHLNLGNLNTTAGRLDEAEANYREALRHWQGPGTPWAALGKTLLAQGRPAEGRAYLLAAREAEPDNAVVHGTYLGSLLYDPAAESALLYAEHRRWGEQHAPEWPPAQPVRDRAAGEGRLRVGYVSGDFRRHAVSYFIEPVLRHHDRERVEVFCYAEVVSPDDVTARLRGLAEHWRDSVGMDDAAVAERMAKDGLDVVVDLAGHTSGTRLLALAQRPAPVQLSYLGYPFATGLGAVPYRLGDAITDPEGEERPPWDRVVRLPGCFCCYAPPEGVEGSAALPSDGAGAVTFCSQHKLEKLNDAVLDVWCALLKEVPGSRLLLCRDTLQGRTAERLLGRLVRRGVEAGRVVMEQVTAVGMGHLRAYDRADVLLDVWPWCGHTTACEALWMGVPVVTLLGKHHAGRMTASVLTAVGLQDLVASTPQEYVRIGAALAADRGRRAELRAGLRQRLLAAPLCDGKTFTRGLEGAYDQLRQMAKG